MEKGYWIQLNSNINLVSDIDRIYWGEEYSSELLHFSTALEKVIDSVNKNGLGFTLVTPFLTEEDFRKVKLFIQNLKLYINDFEIVVSDWGLLKWVCSSGIGKPVMSRILTGQLVDYRLSNLLRPAPIQRKVIEICEEFIGLTQKNIPLELIEHISSIPILNNDSKEYLYSIGVCRFEISNTFHFINLPDDSRLSFSLHIPFVPLTVKREYGENSTCNNYSEKKNQIKQTTKKLIKLRAQNDNVDIFQIGNGLYYYNEDFEKQLSKNNRIDRIVYSNLYCESSVK